MFALESKMERKISMSEAPVNGTKTGSDLLNTLLGIEDGSPLGELRSKRSEIAGFIQGNYDALLEPKDEVGVSRVERGLVALRVAVLEESDLLIDHYRAYLADQNAAAELVAAVEKPVLAAPLSPRLKALLEHVDRLTREPDVATPEHLAALKAQGFSDANIVPISQLIAFLSFQVRTIVGLQLLGGER
jgi:CMD domain protein